MKGNVSSGAKRHKRKRRNTKIAKMVLIALFLLLILLYIIMALIYNTGTFSVTLDRNLYFEKNIIVYDDPDYRVFRTELRAKTVESLDNISYKWLPEDVHKQDGGSHNGDNYIAYTFFVENIGEATSDYWTEMEIVDVIKNVDEAIRVRVYRNGESTTYAKLGSNGEAEPNTTPFKSTDVITLESVKNFKPGDIDKYTIVIWIEGSDPECTDNILGGQIKIQMNFHSEFIDK